MKNNSQNVILWLKFPSKFFYFLFFWFNLTKIYFLCLYNFSFVFFILLLNLESFFIEKVFVLRVYSLRCRHFIRQFFLILYHVFHLTRFSVKCGLLWCVEWENVIKICAVYRKQKIIWIFYSWNLPLSLFIITFIVGRYIFLWFAFPSRFYFCFVKMFNRFLLTCCLMNNRHNKIKNLKKKKIKYLNFHIFNSITCLVATCSPELCNFV